MEDTVYCTIFQIFSNETDKVFIGYTTGYLKHTKYAFYRDRFLPPPERKNKTAGEITKYDDYNFKIIEIFEVLNDKQMKKRIKDAIKNHPTAINKIIFGRSVEEYREDFRYNVDCDCGITYLKLSELRHIKSKTHIDFLFENKEISRELYEKLVARHLDYRARQNDVKRKRYDLIKDNFNEKRKEKYICECGIQSRKSDRGRHMISLEHIKYLKDNNHDEKLIEELQEKREIIRKKARIKEKEAYWRNKKKKNMKASEKRRCGCGSNVSRGNFGAHLETKKHKVWEESNKNISE